MDILFNQIRDNLTKSYIFYLPDSLINTLEHTSLVKAIPNDAYNQLAYIDKHNVIAQSFEKLDFLEVINKGNVLDGNMYALFQAKEDIEDAQFNFLLEKYIEFLDPHCFLTGWMYTNITSFIKPVSEETINLFRIQSELFDKHYSQIRRHFNIDQKGRVLNVKTIVDRYKEKFGHTTFSVKVPSEIPNVSIKETIQPKPKPRKVKPALITDEEADRFLLEKVFRVKFRSEND